MKPGGDANPNSDMGFDYVCSAPALRSAVSRDVLSAAALSSGDAQDRVVMVMAAGAGAPMQ